MKPINVKAVSEALGGLCMLKFFPSDENAHKALTMMVCEMAASEEQVHWLVKRMLALYSEWPGPRELRACFCSKFKPKDGINAYSQVYADGIPSERAHLAIEAAPLKALGPGEPVSAAPSIAAAVADLARAKSMDRVAPVKVREIPAVQITDKNRITQADIDRAVAELREKKAREEITA